ncbi:hypothetical protein [unidentified bacterial endosymbiont]|uniref:hypothetical protein n=1 Tax=unidentified bacterial endosymbiont TaxID=2355 RepID=UPI00209D3DF7|nr:hypothetical protein [unidentified bacterial endosymbiont]
MRLILLKDHQAVGWWGSYHIVQCIQAVKPTADRPSVLGLPTGSIPLLNEMAEDLAQTCHHYEERIRHYGSTPLFLGTLAEMALSLLMNQPLD